MLFVRRRGLCPQSSMFPVDDGPRMCLSLSYVVVIVTALLVAIILLLARSVPRG